MQMKRASLAVTRLQYVPNVLHWVSFYNTLSRVQDLPVAERLVAAHYDESRLAPELPWDCVPVLYNR
jgi:hypothetical protein